MLLNGYRVFTSRLIPMNQIIIKSGDEMYICEEDFYAFAFRVHKTFDEGLKFLKEYLIRKMNDRAEFLFNREQKFYN